MKLLAMLACLGFLVAVSGNAGAAYTLTGPPVPADYNCGGGGP